MRISLLARYLITSIERVNLVTRHLRGDIIYPRSGSPTVQDENPDKEKPDTEMISQLIKGLESEILELKKTLESYK
jgi:hypothetical protein